MTREEIAEARLILSDYETLMTAVDDGRLQDILPAALDDALALTDLREGIGTFVKHIAAKATEVEEKRIDWTDDRVSATLRLIENKLRALLTPKSERGAAE